MKKVIISGATSMLGRALIDECLAQGVQVVALVRNNANIASLPKDCGLRVVSCALEDMAHFENNALMGNDVFYHFAWAHTDRQGRDDAEKQSKNIGYTLDALNLASRCGCNAFVEAGSQAEYGRWETELTPNSPADPKTAYGVAKYAAGKLAAVSAEKSGMRYIHTRIFSVYGPYNSQDTMIMSCVIALLAGNKPRLTPCGQQWDYLYSQDAAKALYLLGLKGQHGEIYNVAAGQIQPLVSYVEAIRDAIDPALPLGIGEQDYPTGMVQNLGANVDNLVRDTGFTPNYTFKEGIEKTIAWVRKEISK